MKIKITLAKIDRERYKQRMRVPEKSELPLKAIPQPIELTSESVAAFHKAFQSKEKRIPPTYGARALQGVFEIVNSLDVDWRNLLHATQTFVYHTELSIPLKMMAQTQLMDCRLRAGMYWLQFETKMSDAKTRADLMTSKSLIMVRAEPATAVAHEASPAAEMKVIKSHSFNPLTRDQIRDYCEASGDWNKIHHDDDFAKQAGLPGIIAHGMLSMGLAAEAFSRWGFDLTNVKEFDSKFKDIALPGDQLTAQLIAESDTESRARILNQKGQEILTANMRRAT